MSDEIESAFVEIIAAEQFPDQTPLIELYEAPEAQPVPLRVPRSAEPARGVVLAATGVILAVTVVMLLVVALAVASSVPQQAPTNPIPTNVNPAY